MPAAVRVLPLRNHLGSVRRPLGRLPPPLARVHRPRHRQVHRDHARYDDRVEGPRLGGAAGEDVEEGLTD